MRIENQHGKNIVCGHIFKYDEIKPDQLWQSSDGDCVTVIGTEESCGETWVKYMTSNGVPHENMSFAFQCRYCLVADDSHVPSEDPCDEADRLYYETLENEK